MKYLATLCFSWFFVTILDYFLWGKGTITDVLIAVFFCGINIYSVLKILKMEEEENG